MSEVDFEMESGVDFNATTDVHLSDPVNGEPWYDDKGEPVKVSVVSSQSEYFKQKIHAIQQRYRIRAKNNVGPDKGVLTYAQEKDYTAEIYAAVMAGWHLTKRNGGEALDVPFNQNNAKNWCKANPLFAVQLSSGSDELAQFAKDFEGNFTSKASRSSTKTSKPTAS